MTILSKSMKYVTDSQLSAIRDRPLCNYVFFDP